MERRALRERSLLAAVVLSQWIFLYNLVNWGTLLRAGIFTIETPLDRAVPFSAPWIFVYTMAYPCCFAPVILLTVPRLRIACAGYTFAIVVSLVAFLLVPVGMARPEPPPGAPGAWLLAVTRAVDQPFNCFPSLHVALDFLSAFFTWTERPRAGGALLSMAVLISVSTLFVKQHYVLDVVAGALLGALAFRLAMRFDQSAK